MTVSLAVTTSTATVGVALGREGKAVAFEQKLTDRRHAEELAPMIQRVLAAGNTELTDVDRLVVDVGPGRFTGLRVGLATVRSLAFALDLPVVPLSSLEILAAAEPGRSVLAVVDARRNEVFQQRFDAGVPTADPLVGAPSELLPPLGGIVVVGDGADRYSELYSAAVIPGRQVQADTMIALAAKRDSLPGNQIAPLYLRDPDAKVNIKTRPAPTPN